LDISTLIGLVLAFGSLLGGYLLEHGALLSLVVLSPFVIVFGGTMGATILSCGFHDFVGAFKSLFASFFTKNAPQPEKLIKKISEMAELCRREGIIKLQTMLSDRDFENDHYLPLKEGIILTLDMKPVDEIRDAMEYDNQSYTLQKQMEIDVFQGAGGYSPTMGVIGTVMGLIQVLGNMTDAEALTKSIGVAFVATLYGVVFANLIYLPAANRLKNELKRRLVFREMITEGICMISSGKSSRDIENLLSLYYHAFPGGEKKYKEGVNN